MNRLDAPIPETYAKSMNDRMNQPNEIRDNLIDQIANLNEKINLFLEQAEAKGEEGLIDESEALFKEIEDMKSKKAELETQLEMNMSKKQMTVCEVCGAMQSATDTDKRLTTHLEGKQHMGYAKVRNCLAELKDKQQEYYEKKEREGRRDRTPSPDGRRRARDYERRVEFDPTKLIRNYSSKRLGTGVNMPSDHSVSSLRYSSIVLEQNKSSVTISAPVTAPDFQAIKEEKERKRIAWEKENGYTNGKPPRGEYGGRGDYRRGRGRGGIGYNGRGGRRDNYDDRRRNRGGYDRGGYDRDRRRY